MQGKRNVWQLIREKRARTEPLSPAEQAQGFRGWYSRGYLPHFDAAGVRKMNTYRLQDAMPANRRHEWEALLAIEDERERRIKLEAYLDAGHGECHLRKPQITAMVEGNLLRFDGKRYRLLAWAVMPNHVHTLVEIDQTPLAEILHTWKSYTSKAANRILKRSGEFWQDEYYDGYIRAEEHFCKAIHYIEHNPVKAGLTKLPAEWRFGSAFHRAGGVRAASPASSHE